MSSWIPIFVAYLVPAVIGLPLILLWDSLSRRPTWVLSQATSPTQGFPSRSSMRAHSSRRMRRLCPDGNTHHGRSAAPYLEWRPWGPEHGNQRRAALCGYLRVLPR
jgi:hypothetical protein